MTTIDQTKPEPRYRVLAHYVTYRADIPSAVPPYKPVMILECYRDGYLSPQAQQEAIDHLLSIGMIELVE